MLPSSLLRWCFLSIFSPPGPLGYPILGPHLGSILEVFGLILAPCWGQLGAILGHLGTSAGTGWAGGDTRSARITVISRWKPAGKPPINA